jgi:hypothetical protein
MVSGWACGADRFRGLAAGKYYIGVEPNAQGWGQVDHTAKAGPIEMAWPALCPGVTDMALAAPIEVSTGKRVTGVDLALVRSRAILRWT